MSPLLIVLILYLCPLTMYGLLALSTYLHNTCRYVIGAARFAMRGLLCCGRTGWQAARYIWQDVCADGCDGRDSAEQHGYRIPQHHIDVDDVDDDDGDAEDANRFVGRVPAWLDITGAPMRELRTRSPPPPVVMTDVQPAVPALTETAGATPPDSPTPPELSRSNALLEDTYGQYTIGTDDSDEANAAWGGV